jgi:predicted CopG family antitoxin
MRRKLTITLDEEVYLGLHRHVGKRKISQFIEDLARPHVIDDDLQLAYKEMGADEEREREAGEWVEGVVGDVADEPG